MIAYPLSMVLRSFRKNKVFSFINIAGLAISMACCMVIGLYVLNEINYDRFHTNINRIVRVTEVQDQAGSLHPVAVTPGPLAPALAARFPEIENTVRFMKWGGIIKSGGQTFEEKNILMTDNSCFNVFSFKMIKGNPQTALAQPNEIVITEATAEKYFGANWASKSSIIGQVLKLNNEASFILAGVVKNLPAQSSIQFDILLPLSYLFATDSWSMKWNSNNYHTYLLLKPGTSQGMLQQKMAGLLANYVNGSKDQLRLQPLKEQYLQSSFDFMTDWGKRSNINYVKIFSGIGLLLLLIACVNFINLSTARAVKRSMEVGIRKVNGASRQQLLRQFLGESLIMTCISAVLAILIIDIASPWLTAITGFAIINSVNSPLLWCLLAAAVLIIGVVAGLYPAFFLSSFKPVTVLKKTGATGRGKSFRQWLVVGQFAIAVALITCTFFMYRQLRYMQQKDLGFSTAQLVNIRLGSALQEKSAMLTAALLQLPGIVAAAPSTVNMANVDNGSYLEWQGMQPNDKFLITQANIDPGFIPALGLQLLAGDNFTKQYANDTSRFIINESAVKRMGYTVQGAIGKQVNFWGARGAIIGVVKDFHYKPLSAGIEPFIFRYQPKDRYFNLFIKIAAGSAATVLPQVQKLYKQFDNETPFEYRFLNESINKLYAAEQRTAGILFLFAGLTIFVACLGLFGLAVFAAEQRVKEIGIRRVVGASISSVVLLLSAHFLRLVVAGILLALPLAWYATREWLQQYAYRIAIDWWVFATTGILVTAIALLTVSVQAIRAAAANPVKSLRTE